MNVRELYACLNEIIPPSLSCPWDNDGLMCCPDPDREVKRVLIALDVTGDVADEAVEGDFDLVISHHPLIFKPIKKLTADGGAGGILVNFIRAGVSVMSFHTRLDAVDGGVNDVLAETLGLQNIEPLEVEGEGNLGRVGTLPEKLEIEDFASTVKAELGAPDVRYAGSGHPVYRVAVISGDGGKLVSAAKAAGADTFVSGELGYHNLLAADELGINLVEAGHFYTEDPVCDRISEILTAIDPEIETVYMKSCAIKHA